jgi:urea transport system ATP-binding protein
MLSLSDINVYYEGSRILRGVNLEVPDKSLVCLMGRNGVGKTTTLKSIVGLAATSAGTVKLDGEEITGLSADARARKGIGYVPQGRDIFPFSVPDRLGKFENQFGRPRRQSERTG